MSDVLGFLRTGDVHSRQLELDGHRLYGATANSNNLGTYIIGNKLYDNGSLVAVSAQEHPQLVVVDGIAYFGEVRLSTHNVVIDITLENYNKLYNREEVPGYKYFDPYDVYNIVDVVDAEAEPVHYTRYNDRLVFNNGIEYIDVACSMAATAPTDPTAGPMYILYNNMVGLSGDNIHNEEDLEATVIQYNAPQLCLRYFNPRIQPNTSIRVPIYIDDHFSSYIFKREVTGPYTVELRIEDDDTTLVRKTVYAGEGFIDTPPFTNIGETWFTLRCIDSDGVGSPVHYLDVYVEDPNYVDNFWEVTDEDLQDYGIVPDHIAAYADPESLTLANIVPSHNDMVVAYKNKGGLTDLFAAAVSRGYNGVVLPTHTYYICDYANKSSDPNVIDLDEDGITYWYCEIENILDEQDAVVGNRLKTKEQVSLEQLRTDSKEICQYKWYTDNISWFKPIIEAEHAAWYNTKYQEYLLEYDDAKAATEAEKSANSNRPIPQVYDFGTHANEVVFKSSASGAYWNTLPAYVKYVLNRYGVYFKTASLEGIDTLPVGSENIVKNNTLVNEGKYYFRTTNSPIYGEHIVFPSNFTVDLNQSTIEVANRYNESATASSIRLELCVNTHIKNGTLHGGLDKCDWLKAVAQTSLQNPFEHAVLFEIIGCKFCSFEGVDVCEYKGYGTKHSYDISSYINSGVPQGRCVGNNGRYNGKRLDLTTGRLTAAYDNRKTLVMSNTNITYNANNITDDTIGYIPLRSDRDYIFVGYGVNSVASKAKRREIFVFFYDDSGVVVKTVKSKTTWLIKIPRNATKARVMGYWLDDKAWSYIYVHQVCGTTGMVYKDMDVYNTRSCIFNGDQRQVLHKNIRFKHIAVAAMVNRVNGPGCWTVITPHIFDIENSGILGKYVTIDSCEVLDSDEGIGRVAGCTFQCGESIQITNNVGFIFGDWLSVESGLLKGNTFVSKGSGACIVIRRGSNSKSFHQAILYQDNTCNATQPDNYSANKVIGYNNGVSYEDNYANRNTTALYTQYDEYRDWTVPMRLMTLNKSTKADFEAYKDFQNTKNGNEYID